VMKRDLLVTKLQKTLQDQVKDMIDEKPNMKFQELWDYLRKYFRHDDPHYWKRQWQEVKLRRIGDNVELIDWMTFKSQFMHHLARVHDYTDEEVVEQLLRNLSHQGVSDVLKEESRRASMQSRVRWTGGGDVSIYQVQQLVEKIVGGHVEKVTSTRSGLLIDVSKRQAEILIQKSKITVKGTPVHLEEERRRMSAEEIFDLVQGELRTKEEAKVIMEPLENGISKMHGDKCCEEGERRTLRSTTTDSDNRGRSNTDCRNKNGNSGTWNRSSWNVSWNERFRHHGGRSGKGGKSGKGSKGGKGVGYLTARIAWHQ